MTSTNVMDQSTTDEMRHPILRFLSRFTWGDAVVMVILVILVLAILFPFWWVVRTALTDPNRVFTNTSSQVRSISGYSCEIRSSFRC